MSLIYVASKWGNKKTAAALMRELESRGHEICYDWTANTLAADGGEDRLREISELEIDGVTNADVFVLLMPGYFGSHVELGAAIASGVPRIYVVGDLMDDRGVLSPFYFNPAVTARLASTRALLAVLT
jgi:hypothetical protein